MHISILKLCIMDALFLRTIVVPNQKLCVTTIMHYHVMHYEIIDCSSLMSSKFASAVVLSFKHHLKHMRSVSSQNSFVRTKSTYELGYIGVTFLAKVREYK